MGMVKLTGDWEIDVVKNPAPSYYGYLFPFSLTIHDARMAKNSNSLFLKDVPHRLSMLIRCSIRFVSNLRTTQEY